MVIHVENGKNYRKKSGHKFGNRESHGKRNWEKKKAIPVKIPVQWWLNISLTNNSHFISSTFPPE